jgi:integrase
MPTVKLTKSAVDDLPVGGVLWDQAVRGFGVRRQSRDPVFVLKARVNGRQRFLTIGRHGSPWTVDAARKEALRLLGEIAGGRDPAERRADEKSAPTVGQLADAFLKEHASAKRKASTADYYKMIVDVHIRPAFGHLRANALTSAEVEKWHANAERKPTANRVVAVLSSIYSWAIKTKRIPDGTNPTRVVERYREQARERYLTSDELARLGDAIREAETVGVPWLVRAETKAKATAKHLPKEANQRTKIAAPAAAALRLLILTGARLREILHLEWQHVDLERGILFLPDSKTGRKALVLNGAAVQLLNELPRQGRYVIAGASVGIADEQPRSDLKRPWALVSGRAELKGIRLHDLRHTFASVAAASNIGLPVIGKLLGHSQTSTTERYAHLAVDPVRAATDIVGKKLAAAMSGRQV